MTRKLKGPGCQVFKHDSYRAMRWRNGRGSTLEIAKEPAAGEPFTWRLSLADIEQAGEFSAYPGYRRSLVLVAGERLRLRFEGHGGCLLDPTRRGARFEGEWHTRCAVPKGRCTDLSLIVRRGSVGRPASVVRAPMMLRLRGTRRVTLPGGLYGALFVLDGAVTVEEPSAARPYAIRARDTLLLYPGPERTLTIRTEERYPAQLVLLRWRPGAPDDQTLTRAP